MEYKNPRRFFEKTGSVDPAVSYFVPLENVTNSDRQDIRAMVDLGRYFSIFAPRQSGKTTFFKEFCSKLERDATYIAILLSFQDNKRLEKIEFYELIQEAVYEQLIERLENVECEKLDVARELLGAHEVTNHIGFRKLFEKLNKILPPKRIVVFIDEFDGIPVSELEDFLTALRELYQKYKSRREKALYSVGLVGIRNITRLIVGGVSPFNIADHVKLPPFSLENIRDLYAQYTDETNQPFTESAVERVFFETMGQPWLVNRLGTILSMDIKRGVVEPIDEKDVAIAIKHLLKEKNDHFENLFEKAKLYKETFVQIVFDGVDYSPDDDDQSWLEQYGLISEENDKARVANPIYRERFLKAFFREAGAVADPFHKGYFTSDGRLDMEAILADFEEYIIQIGVNAFHRGDKPYEKTGQFLLTAWLYQFVAGGGGELRHEVPSGLGRMDILLTHRERKYIVETKINRAAMDATVQKAIRQVADKYLLTEKVNEGYIVIFDIKTPVGEQIPPARHTVEKKELLSFSIGIGKPSH